MVRARCASSWSGYRPRGTRASRVSSKAGKKNVEWEDWQVASPQRLPALTSSPRSRKPSNPSSRTSPTRFTTSPLNPTPKVHRPRQCPALHRAPSQALSPHFLPPSIISLITFRAQPPRYSRRMRAHLKNGIKKRTRLRLCLLPNNRGRTRGTSREFWVNVRH